MKELENYIVSIECEVESVLGRTERFVRPVRSPVIGGSVPTYVYHNSRMEIKVISDSPVKMLKFDGSWPIFKEDGLRAYVLARELSPFPEIMVAEIAIMPKRKPEYVKRSLKEIEEPYKLEKIIDGKVMATYENPLLHIQDNWI